MDPKEKLKFAAIEILGKAGGSLSEADLMVSLTKPGTDVFTFALGMAELDADDLVAVRSRYFVSVEADVLDRLGKGDPSTDIIAATIKAFRDVGGEIMDADLARRVKVSMKSGAVELVAAITALETIGAISVETRYSLTPFGQQYYAMRHSQPN